MAKFMIQEVIDSVDAETVRLGAGTGSANNLTDLEIGKFVKLVGESRYDLAAVGNKIEAYIVAVEGATADGYTIGSIEDDGYKAVTFDGLEATAGTGTIAIGDFVVVGTAVAKGTALTAPPRVCKATNQPGATVTSADNVVGNINAAIAKVVDAQVNMTYGWRVVSLGSAGTGAVGTTGVIDHVGE